MGGASQPLRSPLDEATASGSKAPLTGGCNPGRILGRVLAIDHIQLAAPSGCEEAARRFFGELLGLEEIPKPEPIRARGGVWFRVGAHELHIGVDPNFAPARKAHPGFRADGYDEVRAKLLSAGIEVSDDHAIAGVRRCFIADPWGNRIELISAE
jgi:catechol 2,3-dioxygenase-like lactoylglutathione lyase family enzyme